MATAPNKENALKRLVSLEPFPQPTLLKINQPVVLMHGFGMFAGIRRQGHMHELAMHLRSRGVHAFAPNVPPYNPVAVRAGIWKERLSHIMAETGADKLVLIAHSMGGLDARYLISRLGFHSHITDLVTIASPHHGSSLANFVLEQPESLTEWLAGFANWMGTAAMKEVEADFKATINELTPEFVCDSFNQEVINHPEVRYWSYAGRAGKETPLSISPFLSPLNYILFNREGLNDGFVSIESAQWGHFLGIVDADHAQQLGFNLATRNPFDANAFICEIVQHIARQEMFV